MNRMELLIRKRRKKINTLFILLYMTIVILGVLLLKNNVLAFTIFAAALVLPFLYYMQSISEERRFYMKATQLSESEKKELEKPILISSKGIITNSCIAFITFRKCMLIEYSEINKIDLLIENNRYLINIYSKYDKISFELRNKIELIKIGDKIKSKHKGILNKNF